MNDILVYIMVSIQIPILAGIAIFIKKQFSTIQDNHFAHLENCINDINDKLFLINERMNKCEKLK
jgi:hypothetical protein